MATTCFPKVLCLAQQGMLITDNSSFGDICLLSIITEKAAGLVFHMPSHTLLCTANRNRVHNCLGVWCSLVLGEQHRSRQSATSCTPVCRSSFICTPGHILLVRWFTGISGPSLLFPSMKYRSLEQ